ncbi:MAG: ArdC family protein [Bacteroidota bacterium]|nr:ArdC family protein [Bacteroidota bacterium]
MNNNTNVETTQAVADNKSKTTPIIEPDVKSTPSPDAPVVKKRPIEIARDLLKAQSVVVRSQVESGQFETINDAIIETKYKDGKNQEFKSYRQWKKEGYQVRKGEKAFLLWGKPKENTNSKIESEQKNTGKDSPDEHDPFFPIAFVFSNAQVNPKEIQLEPEVNATVNELVNIRHKKQDRDLQNEMTR